MDRALRWLISGEEPPGRVTLLRFVFFCLVGLDSWEQLSHAGRYGAGRFNVSHFPALDAWLPAPEPGWVMLAYVVQAFLAMCVALGVSVRRNLALLAALNGLVYFWSQLDSYQHHFLLWLMLTAMAGAAWLERGEDKLPAWSLRVLRLQIVILYFWTSMAKMDPTWWSGETLSTQIAADWARALIEQVAQGLGQAPITVYAALSWVTIAAELFLAAAFAWPKRLGWIALPIGVGFHLTVEYSGFEIGLFSFYMVALYVLLVPERWFAPGWRPLRGWVRPTALIRPVLEPLRRLWLEEIRPRIISFDDLDRWLPERGWSIVGAAVTAGLLLMVPLDIAAWLALLGGGLAFTSAMGARSATGHVLAACALLAFHAGTDQVRDYYRYMGGDARQRAQWDTAIFAYSQVVRIDPSYTASWLRLGELHRQEGDIAAAERAFLSGAESDPGSTTPLLRLLALYEATGDREGAAAVAERLLRLEPNNKQALRYR